MDEQQDAQAQADQARQLGGVTPAGAAAGELASCGAAEPEPCTPGQDRQRGDSADQASNGQSGQRAWASADWLCRDRRIEVGQRCKALIDAGRLAFVREGCGMQAELAVYVAPETSGENKLLLCRRAG